MAGFCPICKGTRIAPAFQGRAMREIWNRDTLWALSDCGDCTHRFMAPYPSDEALEAHYSAAYAPYSHDNGMQAAFDAAIAQARSAGTYRHVPIKPGMRVLDVGCGGGSFLRVAKALDADVMGVEPSDHGAAATRENGVPVFHGLLTDFLETNPEPFDLLTANHVMEHHPDPVAMLSEMKSIAAPGATIWLAVPNAGSRWARALQDKWHSCDLPVHLQHFSAVSMRAAFEQAGLSKVVIKTESENTLGHTMSMWLRTRLGLPRRIGQPLMRRLYGKSTPFGRAVDRAGNGDALLVQATLP